MVNIFQKPFFPDLESFIDYNIFNNVDNQKIYQEVFRKNNMRNPLPEGNNFQYQKYIILATQRTGTALLTSLLKNHSNIVSYFEIFSENNKPLSIGFKPMNKEIHELSIQYPVEFIKKYIFRNYSENVEAVGFKLMYNQLTERKAKEIVNHKFNNDAVKIIHLKRKNKLKTLVSLRLAEINKNWSQFAQNPKYNLSDALLKKVPLKNTNSYTISTIILSITECESFFKYISDQEKSFDRIIAKNPTLNIFYEDLENDLHSELSKIISFLNIHNEILNSSIIKQNTLTLSQSIQNYYELASYFKNTKWETYFNE